MRQADDSGNFWSLGTLRVVVWGCLLVVALLWQGRNWIDAFRPAPGILYNFSQEWLSARNYWTGRPVYSPQPEVLFEHTGIRPEKANELFPWNAHPPVGTLLALPFGRLNYRDAHFAWNIAMSGLFLLALLLAIHLREAPFRVYHLLRLATLLVFCHPLFLQTLNGQPNGILVFLLVAAWWADRRERQYLAGACVGTAAAIKLLPAFLFVYWLMQGRWRALLAGLGAFVLWNAIAWVLFGRAAFTTYIQAVVPSLSLYRSGWGNTSLTGFWMRLFDPEEFERVAPLIRAPELARDLTIASQIAVLVLAAIRCGQAGTRQERDRALALTVVGMLLVSPLTWSHYYLILLMPLAVQRLPPTWRLTQAAWYACLFVFWTPLLGALLSIARPGAASLNPPPPIQPWLTLTVLALPTYALVFLFHEYWRSGRASSSADVDPGSAAANSPRAQGCPSVGRSIVPHSTESPQ